MKHPRFVSVHGGHSGQFCSHAENTLEEVVQAYIASGFAWVGITEHMPPASEAFLYPDERRDGLGLGALRKRFADYMQRCRRLQAQYADRIRIFVGFETEFYTGSLDYVRELIATYAPDYIVGSVHHVADIPFDYSKAHYREAVDRCGGLDALYCRYFDEQLEMIRTLRPRVVGHLDIIRIHDPDYGTRLVKTAIWEKIVRNLTWVKRLGLILDFNLRPLTRDESEPYLSAPILLQARDMGIAIVPGDDSHGVATIGTHMHQAIDRLRSAGVPTDWKHPVDSSD